MTENKRRSQRAEMFRVVRYTIDGRDYADLSRNICESGIFIKNFSPPPIGTQVILTVKLSEQWGSLPIRIVGKVVHVNDSPDPHERGMGVEFASVVADSVPIIEYFVREIYGTEIEKEKLEQSPTASQGQSFQYQLEGKDKGKP